MSLRKIKFCSRHKTRFFRFCRKKCAQSSICYRARDYALNISQISQEIIIKQDLKLAAQLSISTMEDCASRKLQVA